MMDVCDLLRELGSDFYTGVPDSQLKVLCDYLFDDMGISKKHIIAANEGNCTALAAGYYLATGKIPVVYMQNSGIGNIVNPVASLLHEKVYGIPCIFIVGWRGEPGVHDEPQHVFQGEISQKLLEDIGLHVVIIDAGTTPEALKNEMDKVRDILKQGKGAAFLVRKNALSSDRKVSYKNDYTMTRESVIGYIAAAAGTDVIVATTGKASRELFAIREKAGQGHERDFLTVGSMGHSSSVALGIALQKPDTRVWCIDGDGAALMHMGAMAVIGSQCPPNLIHIVINNEAHETVGGMPTAASGVDFTAIASGCGYPSAVSVDTYESLAAQLSVIKKGKALAFLEVKCAIGSRADLGRPTTSTRENKRAFMEYLKNCH